MALRPAFLSDDLPMAEWQRRRNLQAAGLEPVTPEGAARLSDDLPMDEWQRIRTLQSQGRDEILYGGQGDDRLAGGSAEDRLGSSGATAAGPNAAASRPLPDPKHAFALDNGVRPVAGLLAKGEGTDGPNGYDVTFNNADGRRYPPGWRKPTELTLDEWGQLAPVLLKTNGGRAIGKYQFMPETLTDMRRWMGLKGDEVMTPAMQDRMMRELLHQKGYDAFLAGRKTATELQRDLAGTWDSWAADESDLTYPRRGGARRAARVKTSEIQPALLAAKSAYDDYVQQMVDEGRLPPPPGRWR